MLYTIDEVLVHDREVLVSGGAMWKLGYQLVKTEVCVKGLGSQGDHSLPGGLLGDGIQTFLFGMGADLHKLGLPAVPGTMPSDSTPWTRKRR